VQLVDPDDQPGQLVTLGTGHAGSVEDSAIGGRDAVVGGSDTERDAETVH
jgi:hypothetical protein